MAENNIYDNVRKILAVIKAMADGLYRNEYNNANDELESIVALSQTIYNFMLEHISLYKDRGIDISSDELVKQYNNLVSGINEGDYILLADTLLYEISVTLNYFMEVEKDK